MECVLFIILGIFISLLITEEVNIILKVVGIVVVAVILIMFVVFLSYSDIKKLDERSANTMNRQNMLDKSAKITGNVEINKSMNQNKVNSVNNMVGSEARVKTQEKHMERMNIQIQPNEKKHITKVVLINEEGANLLEWKLSGKASMIIGKGADKEPVDIDLSDSAYGQMISKQHAVLNYTGDGWYADDIDSKNGTRVKKMNQNAILDLKLVGTVELGLGDVLYIANTMLQLQ